MLYDPKWEVKTEPSLEGFIAWLETKDPDEKYNWCDCSGNCAASQYFMHLTGLITGPGFKLLSNIAYGREWTFGACLARARAALEAQ